MAATPAQLIRTMDMLIIDKVFGMGYGYVLNFSDLP